MPTQVRIKIEDNTPSFFRGSSESHIFEKRSLIYCGKQALIDRISGCLVFFGVLSSGQAKPDQGHRTKTQRGRTGDPTMVTAVEPLCFVLVKHLGWDFGLLHRATGNNN